MDSKTVGTLSTLAALCTGPVILWLFSRFSGWKTLADAYPCREDQPRPRFFLGHCVFHGWLGYNGGLVVSANARGLYIAPMPIVLSFCHDPIFIPWEEITEIRQRRRIYGTVFQVVTKRVPTLDFALRRRTFEHVKPQAAAAKVPLT